MKNGEMMKWMGCSEQEVCLITDCIFQYNSYKATSSVLTDKTYKLIEFIFSVLLSLFDNVGFGVVLVATLLILYFVKRSTGREANFPKVGMSKEGFI